MEGGADATHKCALHMFANRLQLYENSGIYCDCSATPLVPAFTLSVPIGGFKATLLAATVF